MIRYLPTALISTAGLVAVSLAAAVPADAVPAVATTTCDAHAQLENGTNVSPSPDYVSLTFSCTTALTRVRLTLPAKTKLAARPRLYGNGASKPCTVVGRVVTCVTSLKAGRAGGITLHWRPLPNVGDPILFSATGRGAPIVLRLSVANSDDG
ncbi:MAG TPA: hypothetical protein VGL75_10460 [Acidothermaceae bacterium]